MASQLFEEKAKAVNGLATTPSTDELLKLYSLYKQATVGDVNVERPGIFNIKDRKKWDAWNELKGTLTQEEAEQQYISFVDELIAKYNN
ncbi:acyl-CoA-binding protein 2 [Monosporozyma servazzii]